MAKWTSPPVKIPVPGDYACHVLGCHGHAVAWRATSEGGEAGAGIGALLCDRHKLSVLVDAGWCAPGGGGRWVTVNEPEQRSLFDDSTTDM